MEGGFTLRWKRPVSKARWHRQSGRYEFSKMCFDCVPLAPQTTMCILSHNMRGANPPTIEKLYMRRAFAFETLNNPSCLVLHLPNPDFRKK